MRGAFAEELGRTPRLTEGPFYPHKLPLDTDNDLIIINDSITPAVGDVTHLTGRVLERQRRADPNAVVEIWQCDAKGVYIAQGRQRPAGSDTNFQGFGRFTTGSTGEYYFRTIKPVPYTGRTPHIHVKVKKGGKELLTTQIFINGHPQNKTRRRLPRHPRPARPGTGPGRFQADQGVEDRRTVGPLRHRGRPHPGGRRRDRRQ